MTLISSLNVAKQALSVNESAMTVISNNIANVNTEGYSKLRVNLASVINTSASSTPDNVYTKINALSGVEIASIQRYSNTYLQNYYWGANSDNSYYNEYSTIASNIESLTNELQDSGLSDALSNFYKAVNSLSNTPSDATARENYISAAQTVCSVFNSVSNNLSSIQENLVGSAASNDGSEIDGTVDQVNDLLDKIANVNSSIIKTGGGKGSTTASSLLDQRDALVTQLSSLVNVNSALNDNGTVDISLGTFDLVNGGSTTGHLKALNSTNPDGTIKPTIDIVDKKGTTLYTDVNSSVTGGSLGAILDVCGTDSSNLTVGSVFDSLNTLAQSFANIMNTIQTGDPNGNGSVAMCLDSTGKSLIEAQQNIFVNNQTVTTTVSTTTTGVVTTTINSSSVGVTAANLSINQNILSNRNLISAARLSQSEYQEYLATGKHSADIGNNSNVTLMQNSRTNNYNATFDSGGNETDLGGTTMENFLSNFVGDVGTKVENIDTSSKTQSSVLSSIKNQLSEDTGVNLDEELTDLIKYQRAYEAAARVFSTCSDVLQELVNLGS